MKPFQRVGILCRHPLLPYTRISALLYSSTLCIKIKFVYNNDFDSGVASSIKTGLSKLSYKTEAFFICLGDMPKVKKQIYNHLIKYVGNKEIIIPTYKKQQGNPILFSISMKDKIMNIEGDAGGKGILEKNKDKILNLSINDQGIIKNYNLVGDFIN